MIRILLVDDQALLCEVLKTWLEVEEDLQVVGVAHNGHEALEKVEMLQPDIVLMDIDMPQMDGLNATKIICQRFPRVKVIFLSGHNDDTYLGKSLRAGAKGYLLKNTTAEELVQKIRSVNKNLDLLEPSIERDSLVALQTQLEDLMETYRHKFQKQIEEHKTAMEDIDNIQLLDRKYEKRIGQLETLFKDKQATKFSELEFRNQSNWESIRQELIQINSEFNEANRNLSSQFNQQLTNLKKELDFQLSSALNDWSRQRSALQEWAVQRDEMRPSVEEFESKYRNELMSAINPIRSSVKDAARQIQTMRNWLLTTGCISLLALGLSGYLLASNFNSGNSSRIQVQKLAK